MGIWSRLGSVIKSYLDDDINVFRSSSHHSSADPDLDAAFEELDGFLNGRKEKPAGNDRAFSAGTQERLKVPPEELRPCFTELGVPFGASAEECKAAYKKLLKIHHPDRHGKHEGNFKKATEKSARINAAWDRIEKWRVN